MSARPRSLLLGALLLGTFAGGCVAPPRDPEARLQYDMGATHLGRSQFRFGPDASPRYYAPGEPTPEGKMLFTMLQVGARALQHAADR